MLTEDTVTALLLGLVTVTVWAVLSWPVASFPNDRLDGEAVRAVVLVLVPVPVRATVSGLPGALDGTDRVPEEAPVAVGSNWTLTVQDPPPGSDDGHVLVCANAPLMLIADSETAELFGLVTVTVWAVLS